MSEQLPENPTAAIAVLGERVKNLVNQVESNRGEAKDERERSRAEIMAEFNKLNTALTGMKDTIATHSDLLNRGKGGWVALVAVGAVVTWITGFAYAAAKFLGYVH